METMPPRKVEKATVSSFLVHELGITNKGLNKNTVIYHVEEIANRPGSLRVTQYCSVYSEDEARSKLKRMISLKAFLSFSNRKGVPVGNLDEVNAKAKTYVGGVEAVTEEDEDDDSYDDNGIESVAGEID